MAPKYIFSRSKNKIMHLRVKRVQGEMDFTIGFINITIQKQAKITDRRNLSKRRP